jgi:hypothetical protein
MMEYYLAALLIIRRQADERRQMDGLAYSALPHAAMQHHRKRRLRFRNRCNGPSSCGDAVVAARGSVASGSDEAVALIPCPCPHMGVSRQDRHGCVARMKEIFQDLDKELDAWEAANGWLYH